MKKRFLASCLFISSLPIITAVPKVPDPMPAPPVAKTITPSMPKIVAPKQAKTPKTISPIPPKSSPTAKESKPMPSTPAKPSPAPKAPKKTKASTSTTSKPSPKLIDYKNQGTVVIKNTSKSAIATLKSITVQIQFEGDAQPTLVTQKPSTNNIIHPSITKNFDISFKAPKPGHYLATTEIIIDNSIINFSPVWTSKSIPIEIKQVGAGWVLASKTKKITQRNLMLTKKQIRIKKNTTKPLPVS